jgi:endonuclease/exonuclease/phosphatase family metal-dependent hydrolase
MKTVSTQILSLLFLCLAESSPLYSQQESNPLQELRVLCYNIHYGQGTDGKYDIPRIANVIKAARPDIVALQEVDVHVQRSGQIHEARQLAELTGMQVRFGPTQHYEGGLFGNAVLSHLPFQDVHIQPLPYTESTPDLVTYPRAAILATLDHPKLGPLQFISTHFQHNVQADRVAEANAVNQHFGTVTLPTILAGDMNAVPGSEPITILETRWQHAIDDPPAPSAPSTNPRSRIDYVFWQGQQLSLKSCEVIDEPLASDHCPVLVVFQIH